MPGIPEMLGPGVHWYTPITLMKQQNLYTPISVGFLWLSPHSLLRERGGDSDLGDHLFNHSNLQDRKHLSWLSLPEPNSVWTNFRVTNNRPCTVAEAAKQKANHRAFILETRERKWSHTLICSFKADSNLYWWCCYWGRLHVTAGVTDASRLLTVWRAIFLKGLFTFATRFKIRYSAGFKKDFSWLFCKILNIN